MEGGGGLLIFLRAFSSLIVDFLYGRIYYLKIDDVAVTFSSFMQLIDTSKMKTNFYKIS